MQLSSLQQSSHGSLTSCLCIGQYGAFSESRCAFFAAGGITRRHKHGKRCLVSWSDDFTSIRSIRYKAACDTQSASFQAVNLLYRSSSQSGFLSSQTFLSPPKVRFIPIALLAGLACAVPRPAPQGFDFALLDVSSKPSLNEQRTESTRPLLTQPHLLHQLEQPALSW